MFCPYPTTCEWDDFHKAGRHLCLRVKCPYQLTAKAMLEQEIRFLAQIRHKTEGQQQALDRLEKSIGRSLAMEFDYNSRRWKKKRKEILRRDGYLCQLCKRYGKQTEAVTVHHIKHADEYPELAYTDSNLVSLCVSCHNKAHPEKGGGRYGHKIQG